MYLSGPVLDILWSLSYLSTKYCKMARVSLGSDQASVSCDDRHNQNLPNSEIAVMVVNDGRDAAVGVDLQVIRTLLFSLAKIKIHRFVRQPKFFEHHGGFPENQIRFIMVVSLARRMRNLPAVRTSGVGVQGELFSVRHDELAGDSLRRLKGRLGGRLLLPPHLTLVFI